MLAVDRGNDKIANMYDSFNPAVLHAIQKVIDAGHKENIVVGMCGESLPEMRKLVRCCLEWDLVSFQWHLFAVELLNQ